MSQIVAGRVTIVGKILHFSQNSSHKPASYRRCFRPMPVARIPGDLQNSSRAWNAIIRGELSPPNPTPSSPVGGEVG